MNRMTLKDTLNHALPQWYVDEPFGIFMHWGAYSVPAWAEPIGALGTVDDTGHWFTHNPYAEWYFNTMRIEGSPAAEHHRATYGDAPYDDFLDAWQAENFDPDDLMALFKRAGAAYFVPVTKHHDGIPLWDAPGTGERNTVRRGPQRDLVGAMKEACDRQGVRFGVYYSGGLDWHVRDFGAIVDQPGLLDTVRPKDAEYGDYCDAHVCDLIEKYQPQVFWNDIGWPDASVASGQLERLFRDYYAAVPEGLVNDRFNHEHWDYRTSEYESGRELERTGDAWEQCRGLGYSFGYNQVEGDEHTLNAQGLAELLVDVVSRGGHLLLNVGPKADGTLPDIQRRALEGLADWMADARPHLVGTRPADASGSDDPWVRFVRSSSGALVGFGRDVESVRAAASAGAGAAVGEVAHDGSLGPAVVVFA
ncbi:alpha-L-fucosidase [Micrococcales bacterium 31B]|nr:alpha-L-fucosidase [Micrococcales bacterium 31B]